MPTIEEEIVRLDFEDADAAWEIVDLYARKLTPKQRQLLAVNAMIYLERNGWITPIHPQSR